MKCIFIFAYYSYKDPVFQSAVLPYFTNLHAGECKFVLLTWEQPSYRMSKSESQRIKNNLLEKNIIWYRTTWHSGKFKLLKKAYDFINGVLISLYLIFRHKAKSIYSEGFPGAIIGCFLSVISRKPHFIHTYEPHADYMLESGVWGEKSWEYKILKKLEIPIAKQAHTLITATQAYKKILLRKGVRSNILVIPSCVDTRIYKYKPTRRQKIRGDLNIKEDQIIIVYLGKLGGMYMDEELFAFFKICYDYNPNQFYFFLFTNEPEIKINEYLVKYRIPKERILIKYLQKEEVSDYLSAADFGFCGIRPIHSRRYSSPIKNGEYLACGLPLIIPYGISNDFIHVKKLKLGLVFHEITNVLPNLISGIHANHEKYYQLRKRCSKFAHEDRSLYNLPVSFKDIF